MGLLPSAKHARSTLFLSHIGEIMILDFTHNPIADREAILAARFANESSANIDASKLLFSAADPLIPVLDVRPKVVADDILQNVESKQYSKVFGLFSDQLPQCASLTTSTNSSRWSSKPAIAMLSDFDHVVAGLYAEENEVSVQHRRAHIEDSTVLPPLTRLDRLKAIWDGLLPHRNLVIQAGNIKVKSDGSAKADYDAGELSDGERAIFYMLGQALLARPKTLVLFDEPELHINRSILAKLWDAIEAARLDCVFVYLTHDVEFAATRTTARKFAINSYENGAQGEQWELEDVPADTGIPDEVVTRILGSRLPVLFTEGDAGSLDVAIYRSVYREFTVIPIGSCESVIHAVASMEKQRTLHRLGCAGLIDADGREDHLIKYLKAKNVHALAVAEIENLLLLPEPFKELAALCHIDDAETAKRLNDLKQKIFELATGDSERYALSATKRKIDQALKRIGLKSKDIAALAIEYQSSTNLIDPVQIYCTLLAEFQDHIAKGEYERLVALYDRADSSCNCNGFIEGGHFFGHGFGGCFPV